MKDQRSTLTQAAEAVARAGDRADLPFFVATDNAVLKDALAARDPSRLNATAFVDRDAFSNVVTHGCIGRMVNAVQPALDETELLRASVHSSTRRLAREALCVHADLQQLRRMDQPGATSTTPTRIIPTTATPTANIATRACVARRTMASARPRAAALLAKPDHERTTLASPSAKESCVARLKSNKALPSSRCTDSGMYGSSQHQDPCRRARAVCKAP